MRPVYIYSNTSLNCSLNEKCFTQQLLGKSKQTFHVQQFFFQKILPFMKLCGKM
jgi:hypothetical protein